MAQGLGAFTEGFGAGYTGVQDARRRRRLNRALDTDIESAEIKNLTERGALDRSRKKRGEDPLAPYQGGLKPTLGEKMLGWGKNMASKLLGGAGQQAGGTGAGVSEGSAPISVGATSAPPAAGGTPGQQQFGIPPNTQNAFAPQPEAFVDGGAVRHMIKKYSNGGRSLAANQSQQGRTTGRYRSGGMYADGGPKVPQALNTGGPVSPVPLSNGGYALPVSNTRSVSRPAAAMADGGAYTSALHRVPMAAADGGALSVEEQLNRQATVEQQLDRNLTPEQRAEREAKRKTAEAKQAKKDAKQAKKDAKAAKSSSGSSTKKPGLASRAKTGAKNVAKKGARIGGAAIPLAAVGAAASRTGETDTDVMRAEELAAGDKYGAGEYRKEPLTDEAIDRAGRDASLSRRGALGRIYGAATDQDFWEDVGTRARDFAGNLVDPETYEELILGKDPLTDIQAAARESNLGTGTDEEYGPPAPAPAQAGTPPAGPASAQPVVDEVMDMSRPELRGVMPEDMPHHSVEDWAEERAYAVELAIVNGRDPEEAMKLVDQRQMRGFSDYMFQAQNLLVAGDAEAAARAVYAGFSYFPNGSNVRVGITKGSSGQPILMGMGIDEKTGEPIEDGKTMALTPETLAVMRENSQDPSAWRVWTKDWRDMEQKIREYKEKDLPAAQSEADYRAGTVAARQYEAETDRAYKAGAGGAGRAKYSDFDRASVAFRDAAFAGSGGDLDLERDLNRIMSEIHRKNPNVPPDTIIDKVMDIIASGEENYAAGLADLRKQYD